MKIVGLLGSPRYAGNSAIIADRLLATARNLGGEIRKFELNRLTYQGCQGCYACKETLDHCILTDDLAAVLEAVQEADLVVLATPVYYGDVTAQLKGFIDRTFSYHLPDSGTNSSTSRLPTGKKLVFIQTQGHPDAGRFADIFLRYDSFLRWEGFAQSHLIRACGVGPTTRAEALEPYLGQAEELARKLMTPDKGGDD
jgi:multimeric flavodoxin WrbA